MVTVVDTVYAQASEVPEVIVYVDQFGVPISTAIETIEVSVTASTTVVPSTASPPPPPSTTSSSSSSSSSTFTTSSTPLPPSPTAPATTPAESSSATSAASSPPAPKSTTTPAAPQGSGFGFAYSPYNADSSCKTQEQVNTDFEAIPSGYSMVRIYGTDCNQVATVLAAAQSKGLKLFAGVFDLSTLSSEIATIVSAAGGNWGAFDTISIGNELVNDGTASAAEVVAAIGTARSLLRAAGYPGKVVTVDTLVAARANPSICDASDYCAVNCHPFFDGAYAAADAGAFLETQIPTLRAVLSNPSQDIVISETGWPWQGESNGLAVPSPANQEAAMSSIKASFSSAPESVILFSTFNDLWKSNTAAEFQAEQYWGFLGNSPSG